MSSATQTPPMRRSARIQIRIPILITGKLPDGKEFAREAQVLTVSKFGARIKADIKLQVGMQFRMETKRQGGAMFRVVWAGAEGTPRAGEYGVEYIKLSNLLGISFPY